MRSTRPYLISSMLVLLFLLPLDILVACTTPVFRYAMEMWEQDRYDALIIYDGSLTHQEEEIIRSLQKAIHHHASLNLSLQKIDVASERRTVKAILGKEMPATLPVICLWHPKQMGYAPPFFSERLSGITTEQIVQSTARKAIGDHLLRGVPVVWVLVTSGNREKDTTAMGILERELQSAATDILNDPVFEPHFKHIRDQSNLFPQVVLHGSGLQQEKILQSVILDDDQDLDEMNEPLVFPVYGRGRVLCVLAGEQVEARNIQDVIAFVLNPCSCQIKLANPGFDLLMRADWYSLIARFEQVTLRPVMAGVMPDTTMEYGYDEVTELGSSGSNLLGSRIISTTGILIGSVLLIIVLSSLIIIKRR